MQGFPKVISYYTKNTLYEREVEDLTKSLEDFKLDYHIEGIEDFGGWERNCCFKPTFIKSKLLQFKKPVLWIDIDAVILHFYLW